jgi:pyruvate formate lyase activating enzyme
MKRAESLFLCLKSPRITQKAFHAPYASTPAEYRKTILAIAMERKPDRILRICWETNGTMSETLLDEILDIALISGGCIKFDLKAWDDSLHMALTGATNSRTYTNFKRAGKKIGLRPDPPLIIANTLLVPGYVGTDQIRHIAAFISDIDPNIPYSLLAFHPQYLMSDLPLLSKSEADLCLSIAKKAGLKRVRIGNPHLLI